ncbi:MAG: hypothetical protein U5J99_06790 [Parvularculaceae bacterium]|nr:hypothetical protein [Parvularculaceae bacterium]
MGRLVLFLIVIAAALAGVWFYAPGGKDMLLGAKSTVMGMIPGSASEAEATVEDVVEDTAEVVDDTADAVEEAFEDAAEEPSADAPQ